MSVYVVTHPTAELLTLAEARAHLRVEHVLDDATIAGCIVAAREMAEHELQRSIVTKTYEFTIDAFPAGAVELPMGPVPAVGALSVDSVKYTDTAGVEQTVNPSTYSVDPYSNVPRIVSASGWPSTQEVVNAVRVRYTSGSPVGAVPYAIRSWVLLHAASLYEHRESVTGEAMAVMPFADRLLDPYRSFR